MQPNELVRLLTDLFERRKAKNPRYSLRAYARSLGMYSANLSRLMNGKRAITYAQASKILDVLKITEPGLRFRILEEALEKKKTADPSSSTSYTEVDLDRFAMIRDWQHGAILCLLQIKPSLTTLAIAKRLSLTPKVVQESLERLERIGLLAKIENGWKPVQTHHATSVAQVPNADLQECNRQFLELARQSLTEFPFDRREHCGITMTVNPERLPLLKKAMRDFLERAEAIADDGSPKSVYRLNLQLFPLLKKDFET